MPDKSFELEEPNKEELFELLVESSIDFAIFTLDPTGITTSWNVGAERLFGYQEDEMLGCSAEVIFIAEDRAAGAPEKERSEARAILMAVLWTSDGTSAKMALAFGRRA